MNKIGARIGDPLIGECREIIKRTKNVSGTRVNHTLNVGNAPAD